jgi:uncharacterized protein GlcG (DUF336 family)
MLKTMKVFLLGFVLVAFGSVVPVYADQVLTLAEAQKMIEQAELKATEIGKPMNLAVVDEGGNLLAFGRMEDAILVSIDISINKAWTAAAVKVPTDVLATLTQSGQSLFGLHTTNNTRVIIFGGGMPIKRGERVIGGIGVSGGSVEQDMEVAAAGLSALN